MRPPPVPTSKDSWRDLSFMGNFAAAAEVLGEEGLGIAWGIAGIPFTSVKDREEFINAIVMMPPSLPTSIVNESQRSIRYEEGIQ